jgi:hypothetical protein
MNNEPVAWMQKLQNYVTGETVFSFEKERIGINDIPLYTHPAKTLTDEEIWKLWQQHLDDEIPVFVRAILNKVSEK